MVSWLVAFPEPAPVRRDHPVLRGEGVGDRLPVLQGTRSAVQKQNRWSFADVPVPQPDITKSEEEVRS